MTGTAHSRPWDVLVIGGGITGCMAALRLAQAGARTLLVDADELGAAASGRNAGSLHAQIQHPSYLAGGDAWAHAWAPSLALLRDSLAGWGGLSAELGVDLEFKLGGGLLVAETDEQLRAIERKVAIEREYGLDSRMLDGDEIRRVAPYLSSRIIGGELCADEGKASPLKVVPALAAAAVAAGASLRRRMRVVAIARDPAGGFVARVQPADEAGRRVGAAARSVARPGAAAGWAGGAAGWAGGAAGWAGGAAGWAGGAAGRSAGQPGSARGGRADVGELRARRVVLATGSELPRLAAQLGVRLAVTGEPMQVSVTEPIAPLIGQLVYYAGGPLTLKQAASGTVLIGGGWPARTHPRHARPAVDLDGMRRNLGLALRVAPAIGSARVLRTWTGVNNATPDQKPVLAAIDAVPGLVVGTFPYLGFTAGPVMGEVLAKLALGRDTGYDLTPFAPH